MNCRRSFTALVAMYVSLCCVSIGWANVHLWHITEVYSGENDLLQYIELYTDFSGQEVFVGGGNNTRFFSQTPANVTVATYFFPSNSQSPTNGHHLLIGTPNLATLAGVTPDFVLPASFLLTSGGQVELYSPIWGVIHEAIFPALPGGATAYHTGENPGGPEAGLDVATPANYAGTVGAIRATDGDFDDDGDTDAADIDILWRIVRNIGSDPNSSGVGNLNDAGDLDANALVNEDDVDTMLASKLTAGTNRAYGDANLSGGTPELTDFNLWRTGTGGWAAGDFDGSGGTPELTDFNLWRTGPTQFPTTVGSHGPGAPLVPEPATIVLMALALPAIALTRPRRGNVGNER